MIGLGTQFSKLGILANSLYERFLFKASLSTNLSLTFGQGPLSLTHATGYWMQDWEGVWRLVPISAYGSWGSRHVYNLATFSEDHSNAAWLKLGTTPAIVTINQAIAPDGSLTADLIDLTPDTDCRVGQIVGTAIGTYVYSFWARSVSGTGTYPVRLSGSGMTTNKIITLTESWQRYSISGTTTGVASVVIYPGNKQAGAATLETAYVWGELCVNITGQSNTNPPEYVSRDVLSAPYHGANIDGYQIFDTQNGNTVDANAVVTEATGAALTTIIGFVSTSARTNKLTCYNANPDAGLTGWTFGGDTVNATFTRVQSVAELAAIGLAATCYEGNVFKIDCTTAIAAAYALSTVTVGNTNAHSLRVFAMRTGSGGTPVMKLSVDAASVSITTSVFAEYVLENVTPGATTRQFLMNCLPGRILYFIMPQLEEATTVGLPIVTAGAPAAITATILTDANTADFSDATGAYYIEITPRHATAVLPVCGILGAGTTELLGINASGFLEANDGTNTVADTTSLVAGTTYKVMLSWSGVVMQLVVNGVANVAGTFDGSWSPTEIEIGHVGAGTQFPGAIGALELFDAAKTEAQMTAKTA